MSRSTELEHAALEAGLSKPVRVSGLDEKQLNIQKSKEESNSLRALKNILSKHCDRNGRYNSLKRFPPRESDLMRVFGVTV